MLFNLQVFYKINSVLNEIKKLFFISRFFFKIHSCLFPTINYYLSLKKLLVFKRLVLFLLPAVGFELTLQTISFVSSEGSM